MPQADQHPEQAPPPDTGRETVLVAMDVDTSELDGSYDVVVGRFGDAPGAVGLLCGPMQTVDAARVAAMPHLRVVAVAGAGTDKVDSEALEAAGVRLLSVPETTATATADVAMTLLLMCARQVDPTQAALRRGEWPGWSFTDTPGRDVHGATLGLVGYGNIARATGRRAEAFSMRVLHHTRTPTGEEGYRASLDDLLRESDVLSVHVPLTPATRGLVGAEQLALLPAGAIVVNTARGGIVDEEALCDALDSGHLFAAGLDVFVGEPKIAPRLLETPRLVMTPHIGTATRQTRETMVATAARLLAEALAATEQEEAR